MRDAPSHSARSSLLRASRSSCAASAGHRAAPDVSCRGGGTRPARLLVRGRVVVLLLNGPLCGVVAGVVHAPFSEITLANGSVILARSAGYEGKYLRGRAAAPRGRRRGRLRQ
jgi:hypothetical protein